MPRSSRRKLERLGSFYDSRSKRRRRFLWFSDNGNVVGLVLLTLGLCLIATSLRHTIRRTVFPPRVWIKPIKRIKAGTLSAEKFFREYGNQVVIVEGETKSHPAYNLKFEGLKSLCSGALVETSLYSEGADQWAGLTDEKYMLLGDYLDQYILSQNDSNSKDELRYCSGGMGIPEICPRLELFTPIPSYVSLAWQPVDSIRNSTEDNKLHYITHGQPEMFIGRKGTKTELHMDSMLVPFWMSVYIGTKVFRTITFEESRKHLYYWKEDVRFRKKFSNTKGEVEIKELEIWDPDLEHFPELNKVTVYEGAVNAGDFIYLPPATLHGVYNLDETWGVSINSLYPPIVEKFLDVCESSSFTNQCFEFGKAFCGAMNKAERKDLGIPTKAIAKLNSTEKVSAMRSCLKNSAYGKEVIESYEAKGSVDKKIHEVAAYESYSSWCKASCKLLGEYSEGWKDEDWTPEVRQLQEDRLKYVCSQCDFNPSDVSLYTK